MNDLPRVLLVGPMPPPSGGMANQTRQLERLLKGEGVPVEVVQTNAPYQPAWVGRVQGVRAVFRLVPFLVRLFQAARRADVAHVMANSGWAWHLLAAPAVRIGSLCGIPVVVNYRGGLANEFLQADAKSVRRTMARAAALIVPTRFLQDVFDRYDMPASIIPNVVDVRTFKPASPGAQRDAMAPHLVVTRNLEQLYGNDVALRALPIVKARFPAARLTIAGSGPELAPLKELAEVLGISESVSFAGRLETADMVHLYQSADVVLNPSRADNTPNSVLEALACGVPVVSTNVGGVPFLVQHGVTAWLVNPDSHQELGNGVVAVLEDGSLRSSLVTHGLAFAQGCSWPVVRDQWLNLYRRLDERSRRPKQAVIS